MHEVLAGRFIASFAAPPAELIPDFDTTNDRAHGKQAGAFFHGCCGDYCFLPLYVFCGERLPVSYPRPGNAGAAHHAWAVLKLLVRRLRQAWPAVKIVFRGDSGFCRWRLPSWRGCALLERMLALALAGTELARAPAGAIRLKLLKIGAVVLRNTRRVKLLLSGSYPYQKIFGQVFGALDSG